MPLDVSEQRGHTHVIPLGLGRHRLFHGCQQSAHSVWLTVLWHHREWRKDTPSLWRVRWKIHLPELTHNQACFSFSKWINDETVLYVWKCGGLDIWRGNKICHNSAGLPHCWWSEHREISWSWSKINKETLISERNMSLSKSFQGHAGYVL